MASEVKLIYAIRCLLGLVAAPQAQSRCTDFTIQAQCANVIIFLVRVKEVFIYRVNLCALNLLFNVCKKINKRNFLKLLACLFPMIYRTFDSWKALHRCDQFI